MKKIYLLSFIFALFLGTTTAQNNFVVNEVHQVMSRGEQTGFEVPITNGQSDIVKDNFAKWLKSYKAKVTSNKKSPEVFGDDANIKVVSQNTVDIYANVVPSTIGANLYVFVDLGGAFISSSAYPQQYTAMEALLQKFSQSQAVEMLQLQLSNEEKAVKTLDKEYKALIKGKDKHIKEIEKAKAIIAQRENDINKNNADQSAKLEQINLQKQIIETLKQKLNVLK